MNYDQIDPVKVGEKAEKLFKTGAYYCSEAVLKVIIEEFDLPVEDEVIAAASGFPEGIGGTGCLCGAVAGGVMALGLVFGRRKAHDRRVKRAMKLSKELINAFKDKNRATCCRVLTKDVRSGSRRHLAQCRMFTGEMAKKTAEIIIKECNKER